jgi:hypothetical protein
MACQSGGEGGGLLCKVFWAKKYNRYAPQSRTFLKYTNTEKKKEKKLLGQEGHWKSKAMSCKGLD